MSEKNLPELSYAKVESIPDSTAIFDRDSSLLVVNLDKPNDYSGEFINSGRICISLDSNMAVEDMEVKFCTSDVQLVDSLDYPAAAVPAQVTFLDSYLSVDPVADVYTNAEMNLVHAVYFSEEEENIFHLQIAKGIILDVNMDNYLVGIWIKDVVAR